MPTTDRADYHFSVKEFSDGTPWIVLEPRRGDLPILEKAMLGLDLNPGTTLKQAEEIARYLNSHIDKVSCTRF